ncbi:hypothetical protein ACFY93_26510 [Streptomyces sp. NPDC008313]|uniref:hypothetical protein n=1 Tax=Streptomyces sp. NPDC008313 TaxID=3364826 RepID=UPI0036E72FD9
MPRPTAAQLAYGSCTVIFSTLAMLLLSQTSSGLGITVITLAALALGLLVARTVPLPSKPASAGAVRTAAPGATSASPTAGGPPAGPSAAPAPSPAASTASTTSAKSTRSTIGSAAASAATVGSREGRLSV